MLEVQLSETFTAWLTDLRDRKAVAIVSARILRVRNGLLGDVKPVGDGVSELRVDFGPGYRVYFVQRGKSLIVLLCGGNKSTQARDIKLAKELAGQL